MLAARSPSQQRTAQRKIDVMSLPPPARPRALLRAGHVQPVWAGHPWVYAQAIARVDGHPAPGDEVEVVDPQGKFLGRGLYTPGSALPIRLLTRDPERPLDLAFFRERIARALESRRDLGLPSAETSGYRLIHAEGDGLPGLVLDRFGEVCALQITTIGMKKREAMLREAIAAEVGPRQIIDRTGREAARLEGFEVSPSEACALQFTERGFRFDLPPELSQKTGYYFDQRPLRDRVEALARGRRVLDAYSFVGSFSLAAARGGAREVRAVDESPLAAEIGPRLAAANGLEGAIRFERGDAREALRVAAAEGGLDLVICDPPKLAPSRSAQKDALGAYRKLAYLGLKAVRPGGILIFCSCSGAVSVSDLTRAVALGAVDADRSATILERHFQGFDHPVPAAFPEGLYLKSLIIQVGGRG
jgi:23S rRNA (cytosine1962-C5)-methyltransferase